ncbi:MAG TPA: glycosyltransferase family 9 protein [Kiritimatiellia bacterium]|nr:glycosyltransferase family 9 protein [Kiritimatiellia bacterium]
MRILVIKLSSLGDVAHALPAVRALKDRTGAEIDWVVQPEYAPLLACCPDVARTIAFPRRNVARGFFPFLRELRREKYDVVVDLQGLLKSAVAARLARGRRRVGPAWAREGAHRFYDAQPARAAGPRRHAVEELMDVANLVAPGAGAPPAPRLAFPEPESDGDPGPHVALAPFSRWRTKDWPLEKFAELGQRLSKEMGCRLRIVGGRDDEEAGEELARRIGPGARNLCGHTDLPGLCSLLTAMDLLVTVDSGPMHWADALGVPVVAVFGATDPARTGPYRQLNHVVAKAGLACRPCHARTCARGDLACLRTLDVEAVFQKALETL